MIGLTCSYTPSLCHNQRIREQQQKADELKWKKKHTHSGLYLRIGSEEKCQNDNL